MNTSKNLLSGEIHKKRIRILLRVSSDQQLESDGDFPYKGNILWSM